MNNVHVFPYHKALVRLIRKDPEGKTTLRRRLREKMAKTAEHLSENGFGIDNGYIFREEDRKKSWI